MTGHSDQNIQSVYMEEALQYWLFKSEPNKWSWDQQKAKGEEGEEWDGVRNYQARNFMRDMKIGDRGFFYHSNIGKEVVGIVEVCALAHPDSTTDDPRWECVDIKAVKDLPQTVTLAQVKAEERLSDMALVTSMRLSVQPVKPEEWAVVLEMAGVDPSEV
ncbi:Predicted RNA-binding protein, contains PUA-like domain [Pseudovibrio denitrificans]|uniref:Predicted RNA-binding protein, contains PUA-like domain n=1 Tax=Pseudovibrio denitrificans TaxID=258256 RepID=A0A1I7DPC6_9HYPH|nr:Predicted RNA-binding protein, contains PUA-like domain [Pseudovibrio denitrificans]